MSVKPTPRDVTEQGENDRSYCFWLGLLTAIAGNVSHDYATDGATVKAFAFGLLGVFFLVLASVAIFKNEEK